MPIISRTLTKLANREDFGPGIKRWRGDAVDALWRSKYHMLGGQHGHDK